MLETIFGCLTLAAHLAALFAWILFCLVYHKSLKFQQTVDKLPIPRLDYGGDCIGGAIIACTGVITVSVSFTCWYAGLAVYLGISLIAVLVIGVNYIAKYIARKIDR